MEAISPELVLVDPELRSRELARLPLPPTYVRAPAPPTAAPRATLGLPRDRSLLLVLLASLLLNGILVAHVATEQRATQRPTLAPAVAPTTSIAASTHAEAPAPSTSSEASTHAAAPAPPTPQEVERRLLAIVVQQPARHLPRSLIDPATGIAKNNLQAICNRATASVISCVVRPAVHRAGEGLRVRYRSSVGFTWLRYRAGEGHVREHPRRPRPARRPT